MSKTLFVGNLPFNTTEQILRETFAKHGEVQAARIITDRETGRSRGFGFVEMADADADAAVEGLNGFELSGRAITVNEAKPRDERPAGARRPRY